MAFTVEFPNMIGSPTLTALTLTAAQDALTIGTLKIGALAQITANAAGTNLFTPTTNAAYYLILRGQDASSGAPSNSFIDIVELQAVTGWTHTVMSSTTQVGTPGARTYSNSTGAFRFACANGTTWYIDIALVRYPA